MKQKISTYIFSTFCGFLTSALLIFLFAAAEYTLGMKRDIAGGLAFLAFAAGCFVSGLICGLIKTRGGLRIGGICAAAMLISVIAVSIITGGFTGSDLIFRALTAVVSSCTGSVIGVNRAAAAARRRHFPRKREPEAIVSGGSPR